MKSDLMGDEDNTRSGLFFHAVRIIKEMRSVEHVYRINGTDKSVRLPRYAIYENVPGAFSSNQGKDFAAVLTELCRIVEPDCPDVPVPKEGWHYAGYIMGNGYSVAWRTHDAQHWGVAQRRRRISVILDTGGETAPEVLFEPKGLSGNSPKSGKKRKGTSSDSKDSSGETVFCLQGNGIDRADTAGCNGRGWSADGVSYTLNTIDRPAVCEPVAVTMNTYRAVSEDGLLPTLLASDAHRGGGYAVAETIAYGLGRDAFNSGSNAKFGMSIDEEVQPPLTHMGPGAVCEPGVTYAIDHVITTGGNCTAQGSCVYDDEKSPTLKAGGVHAVAYSLRERAGCAGGGKGPLIQEDKVGTMSVSNNQVVFEPTVFNGENVTSPYNKQTPAPGICHTLDRDSRNYMVEPTVLSINCQGGSDPQIAEEITQCLTAATNSSGNNKLCVMATQQGGAEIRQDDICPTITAAAGHSGNNQPVVCGVDGYNGDTTGDVSATLGVNCGMSTGRNQVIDNFTAGFCTEHSPAARGIGYQEECSPTLRAGVTPAVVGVDMYNQQTTGEVAKTLNCSASDSDHVPCVIGIENHPADSRVNLLPDDTCQTLSTRMGTGGGNVPMAMEMPQMASGKDVAGCLGAAGYEKLGAQEMMSGDYTVLQSQMWDGSQTAPTLTVNNAGGNQRMPDKENFNCVVEQPSTYCMTAGGFTSIAHEVTPTLRARDYKDPNCINVGTKTVRRLTPGECELLQGFPLNWTPIGEPHDKVVEDFDEDTGEKIGEHIEQEFTWVDSTGKKRKVADNGRYAALGNSIALPFWRHLIRRMAEYLPRMATLGSLFDGIGGFPKVWQEAFGEYTARWASEIEEFPIAVTKYHFPEPEEEEIKE